MADVGGIFVDIFSRLNLASAVAATDELKAIMRRAGEDASRSFTRGAEGIGASFKAEFSEAAAAAESAYRDMQVGLADLQRAEAQINELRARNFKRSADEMIAAQREVDAALANTQKLIETASSRNAARDAAVLGPSRGGSDRGDRSAPRDRGTPIIPIPRGANIAGIGAVLGGAALLGEGGRVAATTDRNMAQVQAFHQDRSQGYIQRQTQGIYQLGTQVPYSPQELSKVYQDIENHGYSGEAALNLLSTAAKTAVSTGGDLKDTTDGLMTSVKDFGVQAELQSNSLDKYKQGLSDLNQMAGQLVATFGNMKGVNPDEFFRSLGNVEPSAMAYLSRMPGPAASAQVNAMLSLGAQVGLGPEQMSHNVSRINTMLGSIPPGGKMWKMLNQLGVDPNAVIAADQSGGPFAALKIINDKIKSSTGANGMVNIPFHMQNADIQQLIQQDYDQLPDEGKAFVDAHPEIKAGNARPFALQKELGTAPYGQDIVALAQWYKQMAGPNSFTKQGMLTDTTPGQLYQALFGSGDIARTSLILGQNGQEGQSIADTLTKTGSEALENAFKTMMGTLPEQWKQLGSSLKSLAGELGEKVIPSATRFVHGMDEAANWLDKHKEVEEKLVQVLSTVALAWGSAKVINMFSDLGAALGKVRGSVDAVATSSKKLSSAEDEATEKVSSTTAASSWGGGFLGGRGRMLASGAGMAATTALLPNNTPGFPGGSAAETALNSAAALSWLAGPEIGAPVTITIGTAELIASMVNVPGGLFPKYPAGEEPYSVHDYYPPGTRDQGAQMQKTPPGQIEHPSDIGGLLGAPSDVAPSAPSGGAGSGLYAGILPGAARGGVIGYRRGGVANPYDQPLLGQPDMGGDSLLGTLPNGQSVGLRGGEGILTPEAVRALGGKGAIDSLNNDPWSNPFKVATTFYGSFAKGVAKYSPWGKILEASASGLSALEQEHERSTEIHEMGHGRGGRGRSGLPAEIQQMLASGMSQQDILKALGATKGKRGGFTLPGGRHLSAEDRAELGLPSAYHSGGGGAPSSGLIQALRKAGIDPKMYPLIEGFAKTEGNNPSGAPTLGFTDSQAGSSLDQHAQALAAQLRDRQSVAGPFPANGTPQEQASWMATVVGQNGVQSDWQGNAQPSRQDYVNRVASGMGPKLWWSKGGVVGFDRGGVVPNIPGIPMPNGKGYIPGTGVPGGTHPYTPHVTDAYGTDLDPRGVWARVPGGGNISRPPGVSPPGMSFNELLGGFDAGGIIPTQPGATAGQAVPSITTNAQAAGIAPKDGTGPIPNLAPKDMPDHQLPGQKGLITPPAPKTPQRQAPKAPDIKPPSHTDVHHNPRASLTPQGTKPGNYPSSSDDRHIQKNPSMQPDKKDAGKGFGVGGGIIGAAEGAASAAANAFAPGSGMAAQDAFALINRAVGFGGQLVGIGLEGVMETFLPHDSELGDPSKNIFGKMVMGIAGAHPSPPNSAGKSAMQLKPKQDLDMGAQQAKQVMPMVHMDHPTIHNHTGDHKETGNAIIQATQGLMVAGQG